MAEKETLGYSEFKRQTTKREKVEGSPEGGQKCQQRECCHRSQGKARSTMPTPQKEKRMKELRKGVPCVDRYLMTFLTE